jgi:hypothetical protein
MRMARRHGQNKLSAAISATPTAVIERRSASRALPLPGNIGVRFTNTVSTAHPPSRPAAHPPAAITAPSSSTARSTCRAVMPAARSSANTRSFCSTPTVSALTSMHNAVKTDNVSNSGACRLKFCSCRWRPAIDPRAGPIAVTRGAQRHPPPLGLRMYP